jgi:hypothetical protein
MQQPLPFSHDASLDLHWDWSAWVGQSAIASATVTPPTGVTVSSQSQIAGVVTVWVTLSRKLQLGTQLPIECRITTNDIPPRIDTRIITLVVAARSS